MGQAPSSSEAGGVNCIECGCGLPANNWRFVHLGDHGWTYVFYVQRVDEVEVVESVDMGMSFNSSGELGSNVGFGQRRTVHRPKVIQYIRNLCKENGYTCLNCLVGNYQAGYPGWERVLRETNCLLREHGIKVELASINPHMLNGPVAFLRAAQD